MNHTQRARILRHLERYHRGRAKAIPREKLLMDYVWLFERLTDREFRRLYAEELPVCACREGLFIPDKKAEVLEFEQYLKKKLPPWKAQERIELIYRHYPRLRPGHGEQIGLFPGEQP